MGNWKEALVRVEEMTEEAQAIEEGETEGTIAVVEEEQSGECSSIFIRLLQQD